MHKSYISEQLFLRNASWLRLLCLEIWSWFHYYGKRWKCKTILVRRSSRKMNRNKHLLILYYLWKRLSNFCNAKNVRMPLTDNLSVRRGLTDNLLVRRPLIDNLSVRRTFTDNLLVRWPLTDNLLVRRTLTHNLLVRRPFTDNLLVDGL